MTLHQGFSSGISNAKTLRAMVQVLGLMVAAFLLYLPSELGAGLTIPPDSSEYAIGLDNLFRHGTFGFTLNGVWYPSRYSPWFSLSCLTPAYILSGGNPLCLHWAILAFALLTLVLLGAIARRLGMGWGAVLPPIVVMFLPDFVFYSRIVMTEIPYSAVFLALVAIFPTLIDSKVIRWRVVFAVGCLVAWCGMIRPSGLVLTIPFAFVLFFKYGSWMEKLKALFLFGVPTLVYLIANLSYNYIIFGSPFRSGYHYWMSVPSDFPDLVFNWGYVIPACRILLAQPVIQITIIMLIVTITFSLALLCGFLGGISRHKHFLWLMLFMVFHLIVLMFLYLGYYWVDTRFFLSETLALVPMFFYVIYAVFSRKSPIFGRALALIVAVFTSVLFLCAPTRYFYMTQSRPVSLAAAYVTGTVLPENSIVIQQGDPNLLEHFGFRLKGIKLLPFVRRCDYVTHMVAPKSIEHCTPRPCNAYDKYIPQLIDQGICQQPYPETFMDNPLAVTREIANGKRVFYQWLSLFAGGEFDKLTAKLSQLGLTLKDASVWQVPRIAPNSVRHLYDHLIFPHGAMDSRPEFVIAYYEIVQETNQ